VGLPPLRVGTLSTLWTAVSRGRMSVVVDGVGALARVDCGRRVVGAAEA